MYTRRQYMTNEITFEQYYSSVAERAELPIFSRKFLKEVEIALDNGDENLNTIGLSKWDDLGANPYIRDAIARSLRDHRDGWSLASSVCVLKQAAKNAIKEGRL